MVWGALAKEQAKQTDYDFIKSGHSASATDGYSLHEMEVPSKDEQQPIE